MLYIIHSESDHSLASSAVMNRFKFPCPGRSKSHSRLREEEVEGKERDVRPRLGGSTYCPRWSPGWMRTTHQGLRLRPREGALRWALAVLRGRDLRSAEWLWLCSLLCSSLFLGALRSMLFYASEGLKGYARHCVPGRTRGSFHAAHRCGWRQILMNEEMLLFLPSFIFVVDISKFLDKHL